MVSISNDRICTCQDDEFCHGQGDNMAQTARSPSTCHRGSARTARTLFLTFEKPRTQLSAPPNLAINNGVFKHPKSRPWWLHKGFNSPLLWKFTAPQQSGKRDRPLGQSVALSDPAALDYLQQRPPHPSGRIFLSKAACTVTGGHTDKKRHRRNYGSPTHSCPKTDGICSFGNCKHPASGSNPSPSTASAARS
jgi:hypothetical protein